MVWVVIWVVHRFVEEVLLLDLLVVCLFIKVWFDGYLLLILIMDLSMFYGLYLDELFVVELVLFIFF